MKVELPKPYRHLALGDVSSTNSECMDRAQAGEAANLWVTGERQLAGRGSRGRQWVSQTGNLYASLLLRFPSNNKRAHTLSFVASLAISDAIKNLADKDKHIVSLKWPNDVLINKAKTSGILLESSIRDENMHVVIGMGINVAHYPENTPHRATSLSEQGIETTIQQLFGELVQTMHERLVQWNSGNGFSATRKDWLALAEGIGKTAEISRPGPNGMESLSGTIRKIDHDGLLVLETGKGVVHKISVADIFFA